MSFAHVGHKRRLLRTEAETQEDALKLKKADLETTIAQYEALKEQMKGKLDEK